MDAVVAALITINVGGPIAYFLGNRRLQYERLYERRAEVILRLSELLAAVQHGVVDFTKPLQPSDVDRREQANEAQRAFLSWSTTTALTRSGLNPTPAKRSKRLWTTFTYPWATTSMISMNADTPKPRKVVPRAAA
jgi:hypothetical protein